jgi:hypothetical protein
MTIRAETIRRAIDTTECDCCGAPLRVGDRVLVDLTRGTVYCCRDCADMDAPILLLPPDYPGAA